MPASDQDEVLLEYYSKVWNDYHESSDMLYCASLYLDRRIAQNTQTKDTVKKLAIVTWCELLFENFNKKISDAILRMLDRSFQGRDINLETIKIILQTHTTSDLSIRDHETEVMACSKVNNFRL